MILIFIFALFASSAVSLYFIFLSQSENTQANSAFYNRDPDLIVVFTGQMGRIPYAFKMSKDFQNSHYFITGVHSKNNIETLISPFKENTTIDPNKLEIDYLAKNTFENVMATLHYLRKNPAHKRVLVVSHDYHIARIKLILDALKSQEDIFQLHYMGVKTDYTIFRNVKIIYKEVFKLIRTYAFLVFWDGPEL